MSELIHSPTDIGHQPQPCRLSQGPGSAILLQLNGASQNFVLRGIVPTYAESNLDNMHGNIFGYYYLTRQQLGCSKGRSAGRPRLRPPEQYLPGRNQRKIFPGGLSLLECNHYFRPGSE